MQVFAFYVSPLSGAEIKFELVAMGSGFVFKNVETGKLETGTFTDKANKFESLDMFRRIFKEMSPRFELV